MTEARHLWTQNSTTSTDGCHEDEEEEAERGERGPSAQLHLACWERSAGAFMPFLQENPDAAAAPSVSRPTPTMARSGVSLSLSFGQPVTSPNFSKAASGSEAGSVDVGLQTPDARVRKDHVGVACTGIADAAIANMSKRKARRCWNHELHLASSAPCISWVAFGCHHRSIHCLLHNPLQACTTLQLDTLHNQHSFTRLLLSLKASTSLALAMAPLGLQCRCITNRFLSLHKLHLSLKPHLRDPCKWQVSYQRQRRGPTVKCKAMREEKKRKKKRNLTARAGRMRITKARR